MDGRYRSCRAYIVVGLFWWCSKKGGPVLGPSVYHLGGYNSKSPNSGWLSLTPWTDVNSISFKHLSED